MLLIIVVNLADNGKPVHEDYQIYSSEASCDAAGYALSDSIEYPDPNLRSISVCVPQSAFDPRPLDHGPEGLVEDWRPQSAKSANF